MPLRPADLWVIALYAAGLAAAGLWAARRAPASLQGYFLGERRLPWWVLGVSNASGMFDLSGTMWLLYLLFVYGLKSVWIPWLWPAFNQVFLMVYLSAWLRRSGAMTGAEWIRFRFGDSRGARLAHLVVVVFALFNVVGFLAYAFVGIGKFAATFLPWTLAAEPFLNTRLYGAAVTLLATLYVVKGGMLSVVATEFFQLVVMLVACVAVAVVAMRAVSPAMLEAVVPAGWWDLSFGWRLDLHWRGALEAVNQQIASDGWGLFGVFFMLMLFKGTLQSLAGPAPNYDMQRILSTRSPREAAKMSALVSVVLLVPRYLLVTGLAVLALAFYPDRLGALGEPLDLEAILPLAMREFLPAGLLGLLVAALLAAYMGNFTAKVNAGAAYLVNDLYKHYLRPVAPEASYVRVSRAACVAIAVVGAGAGFFLHSLNGVVQWLVAALYGGYTAANVLKWHWWRFNSYGYVWGMGTGIAAALLVPALLPAPTPLYLFPLILMLSLVGCVAGSLLTPPDDEAVLAAFYLRVRPWGFWGPVRAGLLRDHPGLAPNRGFGRDMFNVAVGIVWQTALTGVGIYLVLHDVGAVTVSVAVILVTTAVLRVSWYSKLEDYPAAPPVGAASLGHGPTPRRLARAATGVQGDAP